MKVLVIGSGGREHALCWAFSRCPGVERIFCADGNAGIAQIATRVAIAPTAIEELASFAESEGIDLTFVGGETSLALGIVDEFERRGLAIIGASSLAARLEGSKAFAKDFMQRHDIPTAVYRVAQTVDEAISILDAGVFGDSSSPVVVKADGLAAGKGVVVADNRADAVGALREMGAVVGAAAMSRIVLEERLSGPEVSLIVFCDGRNFATMPPVRDHKRIFDGDRGPNTGGMGTVCDDSLLSSEDLRRVTAEVIRPTLDGCADEGFPFKGILFIGLMMTELGPKVLEYNVRFGDPETQVILSRLETRLTEVCRAMLSGTLDGLSVKWRPGSSACVILAAEGYPSTPRKGDLIKGLDDAAAAANVQVFHAGTAKNDDDDFVTSGGRVLGVTAVGDNLDSAIDSAYGGVAKISWEGMQFRRDIGRR